MVEENKMETAYKLGQLETSVANMRTDVADIKSDMKTQNVKLDSLLAERNARKGGMAMLYLLAAGLGSVLTLLVAWLKK